MEYLIIDEFKIPVAKFKHECDRDECFDKVFQYDESSDYKKMNGDRIIEG